MAEVCCIDGKMHYVVHGISCATENDGCAMWVYFTIRVRMGCIQFWVLTLRTGVECDWPATIGRTIQPELMVFRCFGVS